MKLIAILALSVSITAVGQVSDGITKAEPLTDAQKKSLTDARKKVYEAQAAERKVEEAIAKEHGMRREDYMEWQSWWQIDGDYIVVRYHDSMSMYGSIITINP